MPSDYMQKRKTMRSQGVVARLVQTVQVAAGIFTEPEPGRTLGIDVSHWSGLVDWAAAVAGGIKFAIIKFMDGVILSDFAEANYAGALHAGLLVGAYQWLRSELSEGRQAKAYAAMLKDMPVDIPPAVDYEQSPRGKKYNPNIFNLYSMLVPLVSLIKRTPMIYTSPGFWGGAGSSAQLYAGCWLWEANYKVKTPGAIATWPNGPEIWQFTETGEGARYGVPKFGERAVDLNYYRGTIEDMIRWCGEVPASLSWGKDPNDPRYRAIRS
jgi:GH25 family lysozyme M1 (1,4-beta-N-acetylmuramidase)